MAQSAAADGFWRFSLMVYARPGVADALLRLQNGAGHNVNLVLYALWLGVCEGRRLDVASLAQARAAVEALDHEVVAPLRMLRRNLRDSADPAMRDMRRRILALELAAERHVQAKLASIPIGDASRDGDCQAIVGVNLGVVLGADIASAEAEVILGAIEPSSPLRPNA